MPLDPRLILAAGQGVTPVDPRAFQTGLRDAYAIQAAQQQQELNAMELQQAREAQQERSQLAQAFRGAVTTDPTTGAPTLDMQRGFANAYKSGANPLSVLKAQTDYEKMQQGGRKAALEARKAEIEQWQTQLAVVGQAARGVKEAIAQGVDPQQAWQRGVAQVRAAGLPTENLPPSYDKGLVDQYIASSVSTEKGLKLDSEALDREIRNLELKETQERTRLQQQDLTMRGQELQERRAERSEDRQYKREDLEEKRIARREATQDKATERVSGRENQLRDEFNQLTKGYREQRDAYGRMQASAQDPSAAGDLALMFNFMKVLDPGSTVREREQATAENARGVEDGIRAFYNRILSGERMAPGQREDFVKRAELLYQEGTRDYDKTRNQYRTLAERYGTNPDNVTLDFTSSNPGTASRQSTPAVAPMTSNIGPYPGRPMQSLTPAQAKERLEWLKQRQQQGQ